MFSQDFNPTLEQLQSVFDNGNPEKAETQLKAKITFLEKQKASPLLLAKHYNLLGEIYHYAYDIGAAYTYWNKSFCLIKKTYGVNSIYISENYSLLAQYYSFRIIKDSAFYFSEKAIQICRKKKDSLAIIPVNKIYKEFAYDFKIKEEKKGFMEARKIARLYYDSAIYYNSKYFPNDTYFNAKILHDIGNTYTDEALYYRQHDVNPTKAKESFVKANVYYENELANYKSKWGSKHEKIANIYFVKALCYEYAFKNDSTTKCLEMLQNALVALIPEYNTKDIFTTPVAPFNFYNKALATILLSYKTSHLDYLYDKTHESKYIKTAYQNSVTEANLWEILVENMNTFEIHQALNTYATGLQNLEIPVTTRYYQLTKNDSVKNNLIKWIDFAKYATLLKQTSLNNLNHSINSVNISNIQSRLKPNECVINQYFEDNQYLCTYITKYKAGITPLLVSKQILIKSDSLLYFLKKSDEKNYCKTSKWLYDTLLAATLFQLPESITHLTIIPQNHLAQIPFDALIINTCKSYQKAVFLINHYVISYGLSANLLYKTDTINTLQNTISFLAPDFKNHTLLPFSKALCNELKNGYTINNINSVTPSPDNILHLATHAFCNTDESRNSYIMLSDKDSLFLHDFYGKPLKYKLAILSACETANGKYESGEGTINFNRSLFLAGIKNAITSLWKIDDKSSSEILKLFYSNLSEGETTSEALCNAKKQYLQTAKTIDDKNPYYWAGLIYTGNDLILKKESTTHSILYLIIGTCILICGFVLFRKLRF